MFQVKDKEQQHRKNLTILVNTKLLPAFPKLWKSVHCVGKFGNSTNGADSGFVWNWTQTVAIGCSIFGIGGRNQYMEDPKTHLIDPSTGKAACREYSDNDYIERENPEFVDCQKCVDWYYNVYLWMKKENK